VFRRFFEKLFNVGNRPGASKSLRTTNGLSGRSEYCLVENSKPITRTAEQANGGREKSSHASSESEDHRDQSAQRRDQETQRRETGVRSKFGRKNADCGNGVSRIDHRNQHDSSTTGRSHADVEEEITAPSPESWDDVLPSTTSKCQAISNPEQLLADTVVSSSNKLKKTHQDLRRSLMPEPIKLFSVASPRDVTLKVV